MLRRRAVDAERYDLCAAVEPPRAVRDALALAGMSAVPARKAVCAGLHEHGKPRPMEIAQRGVALPIMTPVFRTAQNSSRALVASATASRMSRAAWVPSMPRRAKPSNVA